MIGDFEGEDVERDDEDADLSEIEPLGPADLLWFFVGIDEEGEEGRGHPDKEEQIAGPRLVDGLVQDTVIEGGETLGQKPEGKAALLKSPEGADKSFGAASGLPRGTHGCGAERRLQHTGEESFGGSPIGAGQEQ